jgi:alkylhydroperoxidase/carboxymuconolactone decarboxylase family protein YurZ
MRQAKLTEAKRQDQVTRNLSAEGLKKLKKAFTTKEMESLFVDVMGDRYQRTVDYVDVLHRLFHVDLPKDGRTERMRLSEQDRERCIIAMLAGRGETKNLALHIYIALMLGVSSEEIADVIFLAGVYCGVPAAASGLEIHTKVLQALEELANPKPAPKAVPALAPKRGLPTEPDIKAVFTKLATVLPA